MQKKQRFVADQRYDLPQHEGLLGYIDQEFNNYNKAFFSPENRIVKGWAIENNGGLQVKVSQIGDSLLFNTERVGKEGINFRESTDPALTLNLADNATNYVEVRIDSTTCAPDTVAIWDTTANAGQGEEFTQTVDTVSCERAQLVSNTIAFTGLPDRLPLAIVTTSGGIITSIVDEREFLFHVEADWDFGLVRTDKTIDSFKASYDALATAIRELKGTLNWYDVPYSGTKELKEFQNMFISGGGNIEWEGGQGPDTLGWSSAFQIEIADRAYQYIIDPGAETILDGQALYVVIPDGAPMGSLVPVVANIEDVPIDPASVGYTPGIQTLFFRRGGTIYGWMDIPELNSGEVAQVGIDLPNTIRTRLGITGENSFEAYSPAALSAGVILAGDSYATAISKLASTPGTIKVQHIDLVTTVLPVGVSHSVDGSAVIDGDVVLFADPAINGLYRVSGVGVALVWTAVNAFSGSNSPDDGDWVSVQTANTAYLKSHWRYVDATTGWRAMEPYDVSSEPTGFRDRDSSELLFNAGTRTFTIQPLAPATFFDYWTLGKLYRKETPQSVVIPNTEGPHFIYFDGDTLTSSTSFNYDILKKYAFVSEIYWSVADQEAVTLTDERHGLTLDGATHRYLHNTVGTRWVRGLSAGNFNTAGDGTSNAHAQLSLSNGTLYDEDIEILIEDGAGPDIFVQELDPIANIPVYYRDGASGNWRKAPANTFPILFGGGGPPSPQIQNLSPQSSGTGVDLDTTFFAQTFTTIGGFSVGSVELNLLELATGNAVLEIWGVNAGQPDHTNVLGTSNIKALNNVFGYFPATFTFSTPVALNPATQYALVLRNSGPTTGTVSADRSFTSYGGGGGFTAPSPGTNGTWVPEPSDLYFIIYDAGSVPAPLFNNPAGPWTQDAVTDGNFYAMWIFGTNDIRDPIIAIMGQREDTSLSDAQANNSYESLSFGVLPSLEMKVLYRLIFERDSTYTNSVESALRDVRDLRQAIDTSLAAFSASDHGLLTGLNDPDHPATAITVATAPLNGGLSSQDSLVQDALETLSKHFGQLRIKPHPSDAKRAVIRGAEELLNTGVVLVQELKNLLMKFDGAEINFETGVIYEDDGVTPLGINFTPAVIPAGQYHWYSVQIVPSTVNPDNTINVQILVLPATASGASIAAAPKAAFASNAVKLGQVYVQESGGGIANLTAANIRQLGTGSGSGGGGIDQAALFQEDLKARLRRSYFDWVTPNVMPIHTDTRIDGASTGQFDVANNVYKFTAAAQFLLGEQSYGARFLSEQRESKQIELHALWDSLDNAATYEVSQDGGSTFEAITMDRIGESKKYRGVAVLSTPAGSSFGYAVGNAVATAELNATTRQSYAIKLPVVASGAKRRIVSGNLYINKVGSPSGDIVVKIVQESAGVPGTTVLGQNKFVLPISSLSAGDNVVNFEIPAILIAGTYWLVIETTAAYKSSFVTSTTAIAVRTDNTAPTYTEGDSFQFNGTTWSAHTGNDAVFELFQFNYDLRVRITASQASSLVGYGVFYGESVPQQYQQEQNIQRFDVDGNLNTVQFTITKFIPDAMKLRVYDVNTGQVYRFPAFAIDGRNVIFESGQFLAPGETVILLFDQSEQGAFDNSDVNGNLLASNHLGSTDGSIDRSMPGRGIILQRPDGTKREITLDNFDNIVVLSVP